MANYIIVGILLVVIAVALSSSRKHFKGEGGCCGGGGEVKTKKKKLTDPVVAVKVIHIEGMHCEHCKNRVERQLNELEGASARVNLKKKTAVVSMSREITDDELKAAVETGDYQVTGIEPGR